MTSDSAAEVIRVSNVSKTYRSRRGASVTALSGVTLGVERGRLVVLLGPSGCGKSTLLRILAGLEHASEGEVSILGEAVTKPSLQVSYLFQSPVLPPWRTVMQNVMLPAVVRKIPMNDLRPRAEALLDMSGLSQFANHYPSELSGGMRQRVALCRALLLDPPILLMDEPFGALDAITRTAMDRGVFDIKTSTSKTILFVTHDINEAVRLGDVVVVLGRSPGRVQATVQLDFGDCNFDQRRDEPVFQQYVRKLEQLIEPLFTMEDEAASMNIEEQST